MKYKLKTDNLIKIFIVIFGASLLVFSALFIINIGVKHFTNENFFKEAGYTPTGVKTLDNKVKKSINKERKQFLNAIDKMPDKPCKKCKFILDEDVHRYQEVYYVKINITKFFDKNSDQETIFYAYDSVNHKFIKISDIMMNDGFEQFLLMVKHLLRNNTVDDKTLSESIYDNYYLNANGINISFLPHKSFNNSDSAIEITIPWDKTNEFIKTEYQSKDLQTRKSQVARAERDISSYKNQKVVAFTFDDGPNTETTKILLDNLAKYDAKVTFFVLGSRIDKNKDILKRAYEEGNDIGSHTFSHKDLLSLKDDRIKKEIADTNYKIKQVIGIEPIYIRPPYGSINSHVKSINTMHTICWNVDSVDWKTKNRKKIKNAIVKNVRDGSIVLVHDIYKESVYGALLAMDELKKEGYSFVTITEMAKLKNTILDYDKTYYGF